MNDIQIFNNPDFGQVRTVAINNEPWFVGKDVAEILGYSNPQKAIRDHVVEDDRTVNESFTVNGTMGTLINESGLYSLVLSSKLPKAKSFKHWITKEVIPSIRKTGGYIAGQESMSDVELLSKAILVAQRQIEQKNARIEEMRPKEIFADAVSASHTTILVGDLAKLLKQNGFEIGRDRLFDELRQRGFLIKSGQSKNMPTQRAMEMGLFRVKESTVTNPDGSIRVTRTTKVTGKGQQYFVNLFLGGNRQSGSDAADSV